jgi:type VI secretion system secreted protein VgrG
MRLFVRSVVLALVVAVLVLAPCRAQGQAAAPNGNNNYAVANSVHWLQQPRTQQHFPNLSGARVLGGMTRRYNCISHSLGVYSHWTWPGDTVVGFDSLYWQSGYRRSAYLDLRHQPGVQKIALYATLDGSGNLAVTHAARQEVRGGWTSKLGAGPLIWHPSAHSLTGPSYGFPIAVYTRSR